MKGTLKWWSWFLFLMVLVCPDSNKLDLAPGVLIGKSKKVFQISDGLCDDMKDAASVEVWYGACIGKIGTILLTSVAIFGILCTLR